MSNTVPEERDFPRLQKAAFALMLFLCVFIPLRSPLAELTTSAVKAIPDVLIAALLLGYLAATRLRIRWLPQDGLFAGFLLIALVSTCAVNGYSIMRFIYQLRSIGLCYILYFVLRDVTLTQRQLVRIVQTLQGMAFVLLIFGAIEKVSFKLIAFSYDTAASIYSPDNYARVYSLFYNPNTYGTFLVFVLFLSVIKHRYWGSKTSPWIYAMLIAQLYLSMSRSSILILMLGLVLLVVLECKDGRLKQCVKDYAKNVVACVLCTVLLSGALSAGNQWFYNRYLTETDGKYALLLKSMEFSMKDRFGELGQSYMYDNASNLRIFFFQTGLKVWQDNPVVGTGFGTFGTSASLHYGSPLYEQYGLEENFYADDEYITILVETGVLGAVLFGLFLISILIYYRKNPVKLFFCVMFGWFGIFFNIFEIQIASMLFWSTLAMDDRLFRLPDPTTGE
ncbi:MAG: O-antigen ligase family protein [Butyricicoccus sp.]